MRSALALKPVILDAKRQRRRDPTRTGDIRRAWRSDLERRIAQVKQFTRDTMLVSDMLGLSGPNIWAQMIGPGTNQKVLAFANWFASANDRIVFGNDGSWLLPYVENIYRRAMDHAADRLGKVVQGRGDSIRALGTIAIQELDGITDVGEQQAVRVLAFGLQTHQAPRVITREIMGRIDQVEKTRARILINTMCTTVHAAASLDAYRAAGITKVVKDVEWVPPEIAQRDGLIADQELVSVLTAGDDLVCDKCEDLEGTTYLLDDAEGVLPVHPNCRCAWIPAEEYIAQPPEEVE